MELNIRIYEIIDEIMLTGAYEQKVNGNTEFLKGINYCLCVIDKYKVESEDNRQGRNTTVFDKYMNRIIDASYDGVIALNNVKNAAYIDFLHDNITYSELLEIRKLILVLIRIADKYKAESVDKE